MKGIFKFLIVLGVVVTVPVVAAYACFYDGTRKEIQYTDNFNLETYLPSKMAKSMVNTKNDGKISVSVTDSDFDNILHAAFFSKESEATKYLKQAYVEIEGSQYVFNVAAEVPMFKTTAKIFTNLETSKDSEGKDLYTFKISNIKLGRIGGLNKLGIAIAKNFITDDAISSALKDAGFHMDVSLEKATITYKEDDLIDDLAAKLSVNSEDAESGLLFSLLGDLLGNDYMTLNTEGAIKASIDLEPFNRNTTGMIDDSKAQTFDLSVCANKAKTIITANIIDEEHLQGSFEYLVHGYDTCTDDFKDYISSKDLTSIGISDPTAYKGVVECNSRPLTEIIGEQTVSITDLMMGGDITFMTEAQANEYIAGSGMIGFSFLFHDDGYENLSYVTIDNFYGNLYKKDGVGHFSVVAGVNFNGYETSLIFDLTQAASETKAYTITFNVDSIHFGEYRTSGGLSDYLFKMMGASLEGDSTIKVDYNAKTIAVDFASSIDDATKAAVAALGSPKMSVEGNGISDNGKVVASII